MEEATVILLEKGMTVTWQSETIYSSQKLFEGSSNPLRPGT